MLAKTVQEWVFKADAALKAAGIADSRREARYLLEVCLGLPLADQYAAPQRLMSDAETDRLQKLLDRRLQHEPFSVILGKKDFYGRTFELNSACLAPRPETELLVDRALKLLAAPACPLKPPYRLCELFCGSGAAGLSLLAELQERKIPARLFLTDLSEEALLAAERNASRLGLASLTRLAPADLYPRAGGEEPYDIILANPPYIPASDMSELMPEVRNYEPRLALAGGEDGLDFYRRLVPLIPKIIRPAGWLILEHGPGQREDLVAIFSRPSQGRARASTISKLEYCDDYAGRDRVLALQYQ